MKALLVHNYYAVRGGEDMVFDAECDLLRSAGVNVVTFTVSNKRIKGLCQRVSVAVGVVFSVVTFFRLLWCLLRERPDVAHVHNYFPQLSPSVFFACAAARVPVVHTLHNFRAICPTATFLFRGQIALRSIAEGPWWAVRHKVYRDSVIGTLLLACSISIHRRIGTWVRLVDRFLVFTPFALEIFAEAGFPRAKLVIKPNFASEPLASVGEQPRNGFLYVGRLSREKGVEHLLEASRIAGVAVSFAGTGDLGALLKREGADLIGELKPDEVLYAMARCSALVVPSICFEGFPRVIVEAMALGVPVIASDIGPLRHIVEDGVTGLLVPPGDVNALASVLRDTGEDALRSLGAAAKEKYLAAYTPQQNLSQLLEIYSEIAACKN